MAIVLWLYLNMFFMNCKLKLVYGMFMVYGLCYGFMVYGLCYEKTFEAAAKSESKSVFSLPNFLNNFLMANYMQMWNYFNTLSTIVFV